MEKEKNAKPFRDYLEAVSLCLTTRKKRFARFAELSRHLPKGFIVFHFFITSLALHFPVTAVIAQLSPYEIFERLLGGAPAQSEQVFGTAETRELSSYEDFNQDMYETDYGAAVVLPILIFTFVLILILQIFFYMLCAFFLKLSRMNASPFTFWERISLSVAASTFPALGSALLGLVLPAVHLVMFYLVMSVLVFSISSRADV